MSGCFFSVLLQKVKFKIQNDLIDHQSASQSGYEDVRIGFKQSKQSFNALKCRKCAIKKFSMLTPGPLDRFQGPLVKNYYGAPPPPELHSSRFAINFLRRSIVLKDGRVLEHFVGIGNDI